MGTCHIVVYCFGTPNPKFHFDLLLFHLAQGLKNTKQYLFHLPTLQFHLLISNFHLPAKTSIFLPKLQSSHLNHLPQTLLPPPPKPNTHTLQGVKGVEEAGMKGKGTGAKGGGERGEGGGGDERLLY